MSRRTSVGMAELETKPHILYRFYDRTNVLLYVGITVNLGERMKQHAGDKDWWPQVDRAASRIEYFDGRRSALDAEREAIKAEHPLHNDRHNEWVEVEEIEDSTDGALKLAHEILGDLDDDFRRELVEGCETDWTGEPVSERERDITAASLAAFRLRTKFRDLLHTLNQLLDLLPDGNGDTFRDVARGQMPEGTGDEAMWWESDFIPTAINVWLLDEANGILEAMPDEEADEWLRNIKAPSLGPTKRVILAARYASIWKNRGEYFAGHCLGPGRHGARCTNDVDTLIHFELCAMCPPTGPCSGHDRWCRMHADMAQRGDLRMIQDDPFDVVIRPIVKVADLPGSSRVAA